jgi:hypothetical protein
VIRSHASPRILLRIWEIKSSEELTGSSTKDVHAPLLEVFAPILLRSPDRVIWNLVVIEVSHLRKRSRESGERLMLRLF